MKVLVTGAAGFIGYHVCERLLARGDTVIGLDNLDTSGDVTLKATRLSRLPSLVPLWLPPHGHPRREGLPGAFEGAHARARGAPGGARGRALAGLRGPGLHGDERHGFPPGVGAVPAGEGGAPGVRLVELRVRLEHAAPLRRGGLRGPPAQPLRGHQARQRDDGARLQLPVRPAGDGPAAVHRVWPLGPHGHGAHALPARPAEGRSLLLHGEGKMRRDFTYVDDAVEALVRVLDAPPLAHAPPYRVLNVGSGDRGGDGALRRPARGAGGHKAWVELRPGARARWTSRART